MDEGGRATLSWWGIVHDFRCYGRDAKREGQSVGFCITPETVHSALTAKEQPRIRKRSDPSYIYPLTLFSPVSKIAVDCALTRTPNKSIIGLKGSIK